MPIRKGDEHPTTYFSWVMAFFTFLLVPDLGLEGYVLRFGLRLVIWVHVKNNNTNSY